MGALDRDDPLDSKSISLSDFGLVVGRLSGYSPKAQFELAVAVFGALDDEDKRRSSDLLFDFFNKWCQFLSFCVDDYFSESAERLRLFFSACEDTKDPKRDEIQKDFSDMEAFLVSNLAFAGKWGQEAVQNLRAWSILFESYCRAPELRKFDRAFNGRVNDFFDWDCWPNPPRVEDWIHTEMRRLGSWVARMRSRLDGVGDRELLGDREARLHDFMGCYFGKKLALAEMETLCRLWCDVCPEIVSVDEEKERLQQLVARFAPPSVAENFDVEGVLAASDLRVKQALLVELLVKVVSELSGRFREALIDYDEAFAEFFPKVDDEPDDVDDEPDDVDVFEFEQGTLPWCAGILKVSLVGLEEAELKKSFRRIALEVHPDLHHGVPEEERGDFEDTFKRARRAYEALLRYLHRE